MTVLSFGALLRAHRLALGCSQNVLACLAGIDPAYVSRLERGKQASQPSRVVVLGLAAALDLGPGEVDRLLVAAGLCPESVVQAGGWEAYLDLVVRGDLRVLARKLELRDAEIRRLCRRVAELREWERSEV